jgi:uracil-DNA glycosylase family protein
VTKKRIANGRGPAEAVAPKPPKTAGEEEARSAAPFVPNTTNIGRLGTAAQKCKGCDLYKNATQAVFGEGPQQAHVMFVGEQPGDQEDLQGKPFVGPAGALLDKALADAGIPRNDVYVTNAVKHFKWEPRGKRRIHKKPRMSEIKACRPWLEAELRAVQPTVLVCLGASAAQAVLGSQFKLMQNRGQVQTSPLAERVVATIHPSAVLRAPDSEGRRQAYQMLVDDLTVVARMLGKR